MVTNSQRLDTGHYFHFSSGCTIVKVGINAWQLTKEDGTVIDTFKNKRLAMEAADQIALGGSLDGMASSSDARDRSTDLTDAEARLLYLSSVLERVVPSDENAHYVVLMVPDHI